VTTAVEARDLGKRYRRGWALRGCTFDLPAGRVSALVGPNGAGKSTLMKLATGLLKPTTGSIDIKASVAFISQDKPLYQRFTVAEMLRAGRALNDTWDDEYAKRLIKEADVPMNARVNTLSGGQRTRVALTIAFAVRPEFLMLDEPLSDLDPLARREVMQTLLAETVDAGMTVLLSSHVIADLDGVCDHLLLLANGRVHLSGDVDQLLAEHQLMIGSRDLAMPAYPIVEARTTERQATLLARAKEPIRAEGWQLHDPTLEELTLAYLRSAKDEVAA
jgi:ABC-2 type transport system ATP-binding protein